MVVFKNKRDIKIKSLKILLSVPILMTPVIVASCVDGVTPPPFDTKILEVNETENIELRNIISSNNYEEFFKFLAKKWSDEKFNIFNQYEFLDPLTLKEDSADGTANRSYEISFAYIKDGYRRNYMIISVEVV